MGKKKNYTKAEIELTEELMMAFLASALPTDEFASLAKITPRRVELIDEIGEQCSPNLYEAYIAERNRRDFLQGLHIDEELHKLLNYIENGVLVNGVIRPFNMIDFFINIDLDYRKLYSYSKMLEKEEDQEIVKDFFRRTRSYYYHIPVIGQRMLRTSFTYPGRVDADGNVISTKRVLNLDEKERILRFLESKNVPFNEFTLNEAFRLFAYGLLDIDEPTQELSR